MSHPTLRAAYSTPAAEWFAAQVDRHYDLGRVLDCRFWHCGINDVFRVTTDQGTYALRVYRAGWRTASDIAFELDALDHLHAADVPVHVPLRTLHGNSVWAVEAPEGLRYVVCFPWLQGHAPNRTGYRQLGQLVATIHDATETFSSPARRFPLDVTYLLTEPIEAISRVLGHCPDELDFVRRSGEEVTSQIQKLAPNLESGFCHGDVQLKNVLVDGAGAMTMLDFDLCGNGWRVWDIAIVAYQACRSGEPAILHDFLDGYANARSIPDQTNATSSWPRGWRSRSCPTFPFPTGSRASRCAPSPRRRSTARSSRPRAPRTRPARRPRRCSRRSGKRCCRSRRGPFVVRVNAATSAARRKEPR
jgi:Ser/Thr protein kinase RdoA (MazF antagonist)